MSEASQHGKWSVSSSEEDDDELPAVRTLSKPPPASLSNHSSLSSPVPKVEATSVEVKPEPSPIPTLVIGSEARQQAAKNQTYPIKYDSSPSLAGKRKLDVSDGSGWVLSDSDDDDDAKKNNPPPVRKAPSPKPKKVVDKRPPSPHGRVYYIDEPDDFFESSVPCLDDMFRFYLNKVTGLDRKYNSGALHIRGKWKSILAKTGSSAFCFTCFIS